MSKPNRTPWGYADRTTEIAVGVYFVSTPSHGGIAIAAERALTLTSDCLKRHDGLIEGFFYFEEDVKCVIPMYEMRSLWLFFYSDSSVVATEKRLFKTLSRNFPDYLMDRGIYPSIEEYQKYLIDEETEWLREAHSDTLIVGAFQVDGNPSLVRVITAASNYYLVTKDSYRLNTPHLLEKCNIVASLGRSIWDE